MGNFIKFVGEVSDGESIFDTVMYIHPFSIESFMSFVLLEESENIPLESVKIVMKSGAVWILVIDMDQFVQLMNV